MKVTLINYTRWGAVNIGVASLIATLKERGHQVTLIDMVFMRDKAPHQEILRLVKRHAPEAICFSRGFDSMAIPALVKDILEEFPGIPLVVGGVLPTATPENAGPSLEYPADFVWTISGEGSDALAGLLGRFSRGDFTAQHSILALPEDIAKLPIPDFTLFDMRKYFRVTTRIDGELPIYASKGCPYRCVFCSLCNRPFQHKRPEQVLEEIKYQEEAHSGQGLKSFSFYDPTFGALRKEFTKMMELFHQDRLDERVTWFCETRAEMVTKRWAKQAALGGCQLVELGVDCGDEAKRRNLLGKSTLDRQFRSAARNLREAGLQYEVNLITGLPGTEFSTDVQSLLFAMSLKPAKINIGQYYPLHDTPLGKAFPHARGKSGWQRVMTAFRGGMIRFFTIPQFLYAGIASHGRAYLREFFAYALNTRDDRMRPLLHQTSRHILSRWPNSRLFRERVLRERRNMQQASSSWTEPLERGSN